MPNTILLSGLLVLALSACAGPNVSSTKQSGSENNNTSPVFGEKCKEAKYQLEKTVEEGQLGDLRELKRRIELHCIWRRN